MHTFMKKKYRYSVLRRDWKNGLLGKMESIGTNANFVKGENSSQIIRSLIAPWLI